MYNCVVRIRRDYCLPRRFQKVKTTSSKSVVIAMQGLNRLNHFEVQLANPSGCDSVCVSTVTHIQSKANEKHAESHHRGHTTSRIDALKSQQNIRPSFHHQFSHCTWRAEVAANEDQQVTTYPKSWTPAPPCMPTFQQNHT